jgi:hypothetical protein
MLAQRRTLVLSLIVMSFAPWVDAQVTLQWARCYNGPANDWDGSLAIAVDDSGYVYVAGGSPGVGTNYDYATIKYAPTGDSLWAQRFNSNSNIFDVGRDITVDDSGNVYVTGGSFTLCYNRNGVLRWLHDNGAECIRIHLSHEGYIYVAGTGFGDGKTIKLTTNGTLIWERIYNSPANDQDRINDMVLDSAGNIIVTGGSWGVSTQWDYATVKYSSNGETLWVRRYNGPALDVPTDEAYGIAVDDSNNVYVTGWSDGTTERPQCLTIKYSAFGDTLWERRYPTGGTVGYAGHDIVYDRGFIYVVARADGFNDTLLKYDQQGNLIWTRVYTTNNFAAPPPRLAADTAGNIYMTSSNSVGRSDFIVVKYASSGTFLWEYKYPDSGMNTTNNARVIAVHKQGNVYLTGESSGWVCPGASYDYLTLKLSQGPTSVHQPDHLPTEYQLRQNYPNPFNPSTTFAFSLPRRSLVSLKVFDLLGRVVATIVSEELSAGRYSREWSADGLASGVYLYRIQAGQFSQTKKLILLR